MHLAQTLPAGGATFYEIVLPLIPWVLIFIVIVVVVRIGKGNGKAH